VHLHSHFEDVSSTLQQAFTNMTETLLIQEQLDTRAPQTEGSPDGQKQDSRRADDIQRDQVDWRCTKGNGEPPSIMNNGACSENTVENPEPILSLDSVWEDGFIRNKSAPAKSLAEVAEAPSSPVIPRKRVSRWAGTEINKLMGTRPRKADANTFRGRLENLLHGPFNPVICSLIVLNALAAFARLELLSNRANRSLGEDYEDWSPLASPIFNVLEIIFTSIFFLELVIRIYVFQRWFFSEYLNLLDLLVVGITAVSILFSDMDTLFESEDQQVEHTSARRELLRLITVVRTARILRTMRYLKELRFILDTLLGSLGAVFWSILLMVMFQWMMAMVLCQSLHGFIVDASQDLVERKWVNAHYGSGFASFYTLFEATFSGCWPNYFRPLMTYVSPYFGVPIVAYVIVVIFTMTRVVSALFLREILRQASEQAEIMVKERKKETRVVTRKLHDIFRAADTSGDGLLTEDEMTHMLSHEKVRILLSKLGLEASDGHVLFNMLDDGRGFINRDEFVSGIKHLKGEARSIDLVPLTQNCHHILENLQALRATQADFCRRQSLQSGHSCLMANGCNLHYQEASHQQRKALI